MECPSFILVPRCPHFLKGMDLQIQCSGTPRIHIFALLKNLDSRRSKGHNGIWQIQNRDCIDADIPNGVANREQGNLSPQCLQTCHLLAAECQIGSSQRSESDFMRSDFPTQVFNPP